MTKYYAVVRVDLSTDPPFVGKPGKEGSYSMHYDPKEKHDRMSDFQPSEFGGIWVKVEYDDAADAS